MKVLAKDFHPMRGHVEDGAVVKFSDGSTWTLRSTMTGWTAIDSSGAAAFHPVRSAFELTAKIVQRESA